MSQSLMKTSMRRIPVQYPPYPGPKTRHMTVTSETSHKPLDPTLGSGSSIGRNQDPLPNDTEPGPLPHAAPGSRNPCPPAKAPHLRPRGTPVPDNRPQTRATPGFMASAELRGSGFSGARAPTSPRLSHVERSARARRRTA